MAETLRRTGERLAPPPPNAVRPLRHAVGGFLFPIPAARIASSRVRTLLLLAIVLPLWSSYLVRVYAWRPILSGDGVLNWSLHQLHLGSVNLGFSRWSLWIVFSYLWLPYVALPVYAALERIPNSLIEASTDLGAP